jgi:hypothetical protein
VVATRRRPITSTSRESGAMIERSASTCSSVKPPACFVVQLVVWAEPSMKRIGSAM